MIKKFEDFINENNNFGNFGKIKFKDKEDELRYKKLFKERKAKEKKEELENLKKYEKYFNGLVSEKINKKDLKDVLSDISNYLKVFKSPFKRFVKEDNIGDEFMNMAYNIHKLYMPDGMDDGVKTQDGEEFNEIKVFHQAIVKDFIGIENVFESADKEHEEIVKTFYKYLMFVDRFYHIWS